MNTNQELKDLIDRIKFVKKVRQSDIADELDIAPTYLSDMINGRVPLTNSLKKKLLEQYSDCFTATASAPRSVSAIHNTGTISTGDVITPADHAAPSSSLSALRSQIKLLERLLSEKDKLISTLTAQLSDKERLIQFLSQSNPN